MTSKVIDLMNTLLKREFNANETIAQMRMNSELTWKVLSWGAKNWGVLNGIPDCCKGMAFKVNARRHKGYVLIALNWDDTYEVHLISTRGNLVHSMDNIYFDELTEKIDDKIEKVSDYAW